MIILTLLAMAMSAPLTAPRTCAPFQVAIDPAEQSLDAAMLTKAYGRRVDPTSISEVLATTDWKIIWASASDDIVKRAFFVRFSRGDGAYKGSWSTVGVPKAKYYRFARGLNVPSALARCFADRISSEPAL